MENDVLARIKNDNEKQKERLAAMLHLMKGEDGAVFIEYIEDIVYPVTMQTDREAYAYICGRVSLLSDLKRIKNLADVKEREI